MAKKTAGAKATNGEGGSVASYFKAIFEENPQFLVTRSNEELLQRWLKDHPGEKVVPDRIKGNLANIKSVLRKKKRKKTGKKKPLSAGVAGAQSTAVAVTQKTPTTGARRLEQLEEAIDDCLTTARHMDKDGLAGVINFLRRARNEVVWKLGQ